MTRRTFLQAIATIAAATSTAGMARYLPSPATGIAPPVIDWQMWNRIELSHHMGKIRGSINGVDISAFPSVMQRLCTLVEFDEAQNTVILAKQIRWRTTREELDLRLPCWFSCHLKLSEESNQTVWGGALLDDIVVGSDGAGPA